MAVTDPSHPKRKDYIGFSGQNTASDTNSGDCMDRYELQIRTHLKDLAATLSPLKDHSFIIYPSTIRELVHALSPSLDVQATDSTGHDLHYAIGLHHTSDEPLHSFYALLFSNGHIQPVGAFSLCGQQFNDVHGLELCVKDLLEHYKRQGITMLYEHPAGTDAKHPWRKVYTHNTVEYPMSKDISGLCMGKPNYVPPLPKMG